MTSEPDRLGEYWDWALGELDPERALQVRQRIQSDPEAALEAGELRALLEDMRTLTVEPTDDVDLAVRYAVRRRLELRHQLGMRRSRSSGSLSSVVRSPVQMVRIVAVAAVVLFGMLLWQHASGTPVAIDHNAVAVLEQPESGQPESGQPESGQFRSGVLQSGVFQSGPFQTGLPELAPPQSTGGRPATSGTDGIRSSDATSDVGVLDSEATIDAAWDPEALATVGDTLRRHYESLRELGQIDVFTRLVQANDALEMLRMEFRHRFSRQERRRSIELSGGRADLEDRIQDLARTIAVRVERDAGRGGMSVPETALAMRALLASGSSLRIGHRRAVRIAFDRLKDELAQLDGGQLAAALAGLTDLAVIDRTAAKLVGAHGDRLAMSILMPAKVRHSHGYEVEARTADANSQVPKVGQRLEHPVVGARRPELLRFGTPAACLADAGYVLRLAPAFGVHPRRAHYARLLMAAHLEERLVRNPGGRPDLLAAQLYGFGDLVDRRAIDRKLLLWRLRLLARDDFVVVHHVTWSQYPPRAGWANFQSELRELASMKSPAEISDASALLLSLAMNFAAPGVHQVLDFAAG